MIDGVIGEVSNVHTYVRNDILDSSLSPSPSSFREKTEDLQEGHQSCHLPQASLSWEDGCSSGCAPSGGS